MSQYPGPSEVPPPGQLGQPPQGEPAYGQPAYGQPAYGQPAYGQPAYGQPAYGQPAYGQPADGQPAYGQPAYGQPAFGQPAPQYGQAPYNPAAFPPPGYPPAGYAQPGYGQPAYLAPPVAKPTGWFIVNWLFFWPTAIYSLVSHWNKIDPAAYAGDLATAQFHASKVKKQGIIALCIFGGLMVFYVILLVTVLSALPVVVNSVPTS
jgi:hypothetical protein